MNFSAADHGFMTQALRMAEKGRYTTHPNPRVGCVIVKAGQVVGEGYHLKAGEAHAEVHALIQAGEQAQGATVYVTLEPCSHTGKTPPCVDALIAAKIARVVVAMVDPNPQVAGQGLVRLQTAGITVQSGLMETQARALNQGFISQMERQRPYVRVKLAMSLDGRTAMQSGESQWITGVEARQDVQLLRAQASAIVTGIGTVLMDNPSLNVRVEASTLGLASDTSVRQPLRVILDSQLRTPLAANVLNMEGEVLIITASHDRTRINALQARGAMVEVLTHPENPRVFSLPKVLQLLAERHLHELHIEAGATLSGALLAQQLVDEIVLYVAPMFMGSEARGLLTLPFQQMAQCIKLTVTDMRAVGADWRWTLCPQYS